MFCGPRSNKFKCKWVVVLLLAILPFTSCAKHDDSDFSPKASSEVSVPTEEVSPPAQPRPDENSGALPGSQSSPSLDPRENQRHISPNDIKNHWIQKEILASQFLTVKSLRLLSSAIEKVNLVVGRFLQERTQLSVRNREELDIGCGKLRRLFPDENSKMSTYHENFNVIANPERCIFESKKLKAYSAVSGTEIYHVDHEDFFPREDSQEILSFPRSISIHSSDAKVQTLFHQPEFEMTENKRLEIYLNPVEIKENQVLFSLNVMEANEVQFDSNLVNLKYLTSIRNLKLTIDRGLKKVVGVSGGQFDFYFCLQIDDCDSSQVSFLMEQDPKSIYWQNWTLVLNETNLKVNDQTCLIRDADSIVRLETEEGRNIAREVNRVKLKDGQLPVKFGEQTELFDLCPEPEESSLINEINLLRTMIQT